MRSVRSPASARQAARLIAVVVLPTPPFWLASAYTRPGIRSRYLRKRTFLCDPGPAREALRSGPGLSQNDEPGRRFRGLGGKLLGHARDPVGLGARAHVEDRRAARGDQRQAPLRGDR